MGKKHHFAITRNARIAVLQLVCLRALFSLPIATSLFSQDSPSSGSRAIQNREASATIQANRNPGSDSEKHDEEGLVFEGEFNYQSDVLPLPTTVSSGLFDFFLDPRNRDLVIKGGGNHCKHVPSTREWHEEWKSQSKIVHTTPPEPIEHRDDQEILAVYSEVPIVPGLSLRAVSYTGCKILKEPTTALPYYEFTLLKETYRPVGKKAMTWIFDKVTGNTGKNQNANQSASTMGRIADYDYDASETISFADATSARKTYAASRVTLEAEDGGCKICYHGKVRLTLSKKFLHMLPLPKKVVQAKVNKSIRKQLERECTLSLEKFTRALNQWNEQNTIPR